MMRRIVSIGLVLAAAAGVAEAGGIAGTWTASLSKLKSSHLNMSMQVDDHGNNGNRFDLAAFTGLDLDQVESETQVPVRFELRREAGTVSFDGHFRNGKGTGEFSFTPQKGFLRTLDGLGLEIDTRKHGELEELYQLTLFDVSSDFIRSMQRIGYEEGLERYKEFRIFRVDPDYVREMAAVGFARLSASKLVETRIHGATPEYIREMRAHGEDLTLDEYIQSRIFQVTPEFASEMSRAGYPNLGRDVLVQFKIHGVTPEFVRDLREIGYSRIPAQKLVEMRIHGVTPEFIREVEAAGYRKVPIDKLVQMRIFDIDPKMGRALDDAD